MKALPWWMRGRWLVGHLIIGGAILVMANLAAWQFDRLDERKVANRETQHLIDRAPVTVSNATDLAGRQRWEKVVVEGWPLEDQRFLVRYQLLEGRTGYWLVEPVTTGRGQVVFVTLGWIPQDVGETLPRLRAAAPTNDAVTGDVPGRPVRYEGFALPGVACSGRVGDLTRIQPNAGDPPVSTVADFNCANLRLLDSKLDSFAPSHPDAPQLDQHQPQHLDPARDAAALQLKALPGPDLSEGPHFSYALQWIAFCLVIGLGWITLLFRVFRTSRGRRQAANSESTPPR